MNVANTARPRKIKREKGEVSIPTIFPLKRWADTTCLSTRFLNTLVFKSHQVLKTAMKDHSPIVPELDKRGKATAVNKLDDQRLADNQYPYIDSYDTELATMGANIHQIGCIFPLH